jgi:hypothetical protein
MKGDDIKWVYRKNAAEKNMEDAETCRNAP